MTTPRKLPSEQFWGTGVAAVASASFDPVSPLPFTVAVTDPVATAGSCFAQHLGHHLRRYGYNYLQPEPPASLHEPGYSARYGNIFTTRQLRQLMLCAYGLHRPEIRTWRRSDGRYIDPLRPQIFPAGFATPEEVLSARSAHLTAVRRVFQECRVFVFTAGGTEVWQAADGTALPILPGAVHAEMPEGRVRLANLSAADMRQDLTEFLADLAAVNPGVRVIFTLSPVPGVATYQARHVLSASNASKAAIRVALEEIVAAHANAAYFPSYEIITAPQHRGGFIADDLRTVTDDGMARVMHLFSAHVMRDSAPEALLPVAELAHMDDDTLEAALRDEDASRPAQVTLPPADAPDPAMYVPPVLDPAAAATGNLPLEVDFRTGGDGHQFLKSGWSHPELECTWTLGKISVLRLPAGAVDCDCSLKFRASPLVKPGVHHFQRLQIDVNGVTVARLVGRQPSQFEVLIPAEVLRGRPNTEIVFRMPDTTSPQALGNSNDRRELGFSLVSLRLEPLLEGPGFETAAAEAPAARAAAAPAGGDIKATMMELQSLGANCELGFVQRTHGAEPLGLFRWGNTPLPNLLRALDARFEGLGAAENTLITLDAETEFLIVDNKYGFRNHSFAYQNQGATEEKVRERELVRLPFLARLMIEDLEQGDKLFCFHDSGHSNEDDIERLLDAIQKYGPGWLLWICPGSAAQTGTAEFVHDGLIRGYIDVFQPLEDVSKPSLDAWTRAVISAHRIWQAAAK